MNASGRKDSGHHGGFAGQVEGGWCCGGKHLCQHVQSFGVPCLSFKCFRLCWTNRQWSNPWSSSSLRPGVLFVETYTLTTKWQFVRNNLKYEPQIITYFLKFFDSSTSSLPGRRSFKSITQRLGQLFGRQSQSCHRPRPEGGNAMRCHEMLCRMAFFHSAVLGFVVGAWRDVSGGPGCHEVRLLSFCLNNLGFKMTQQACKYHRRSD